MDFSKTMSQSVMCKYGQYVLFMFFHWGRLFLGWLRECIVDPLTSYIEKYLKHEPKELHWSHLYSLTAAESITDLGMEVYFYGSEEIYNYPYSDDISDFVEEEYDRFINSTVKLKYDAEFEKTPELVESLFMVKNDTKYMIRSFPIFKSLKENKMTNYFEDSNVEFMIVEYNHPDMHEGITLEIPKGYFMVGNELFSPAFVQRCLELQRKYYIFDMTYSISFIDDNLDKQILTYEDYVYIDKETYVKRNVNDEELMETDDEIKEEDPILIDTLETVDKERSFWSLLFYR